MNKTLVRIISAVVLGVMLLGTVAAAAVTAFAAEASAQTEKTAVLITKSKGSDYRIVCSGSQNGYAADGARELRDAIKEETGVRLTLTTNPASVKAKAREILIGKTNRKLSQSAEEEWEITKGLRWKICLDGETVLIYAEEEASLKAALSYFTENFLTDGGVRMPEGYSYTYAGEGKDTDADTDTDTDTKADAESEADKKPEGSAEVDSTEPIDMEMPTTQELRKWMEYVDARAKRGRSAYLKSHMKSVNKSNILDTDIYGRTASVVLAMPDKEVSSNAIKHANRIIRKVCGFMTTDVPTSVKNGNGVKGECDFAAICLAQVLYADKDRIEASTAKKLKEFFLNNDFQSQYYSENHMLIFRCARYLAACYYEDEYFKQYKKTGAQLREIDREYLISFLQHRAKQGWAEFDSMGYIVEDFSCLIAVYDHGKDRDLRKIVQMTLDTLLLNMIVDTTENGIYGGAHGRNYDVVKTNLYSRMYWIYYLYFGKSDFSDNSSAMSAEGYHVYTSDYRPHETLYAIVANKTYPYTNYERIHNHTLNWEPKDFGSINKYTYNTKLYSIGCVNQQDPIPNNTGNYEEHQQTNFSLTFAKNSKASVIVHHPGNTGTHRYWNGDTNCFCNHLFGHKNVVMGIYYIHGNAGQYNFIHAYVPKGQYTQIIENRDKGIVYIRLDDAYAVLRFSAPYKWSGSDSSEILIYDGNKKSDIRIAMVCEAGDKDTYGSFSNFVAEMRKKEMIFDENTLTLSYGEMKMDLEDYNYRYGVVETRWLDGEELTFPYAYTYNSPYMKSEWNSGVIELYCGDTVRVMDFMNIKDTMKKK